MAYRLEDRFTEPELIRWVDRQADISGWLGMFWGGIGTGIMVGLVLGYLWWAA